MGGNGVLGGMSEGSLLVDMSTISPVVFVVLREARSGGEESPASHLEQRMLAHKPRGQVLVGRAQPLCQDERRRSEDSESFRQ
jgi:hypothetical protein